MDKKTKKLSIRRAGGTASKTAFRFSLELPKPWLDQMGISPEENEVALSFDGEKIMVEKSV